jgi:FAD/FMN-containing dehydrogenase
VTLRDLNRTFLPQGWSAPVSPGTQFVTLGGMVAADVHGKNHHVRGTFGEHVRCLRMQFALEEIPSPWILSQSERHASLDAVVRALLEESRNWPFTVAWVDCLKRGAQMGRGIVMCGRWADRAEIPAKDLRQRGGITVPFLLPGWVLGPRSVRTFNRFYFRKHGRGVRRGVVHPEAFFYPLDALGSWNRLYGRRGFTQYQCVLPEERSCRRLFELLAAREGACFLGVVKDCGEAGKGMISFPQPGISIALDIPLQGKTTQELVDALNGLVADEGGRIYLAKDALTRPEHFRDLETRVEAWNAVRRRWDPQGRLRSALSCRLLGDCAGAAT